MITISQLARIMQCKESKAALWHAHIVHAMDLFDISTPLRITAFLAQIGHESGRLTYVRELWNPAQCPWQLRYEGRADLGNAQPGDGMRFMGRGLIQITGRANNRACGEALGLPLEEHPELLEEYDNAACSAAWFWATHGCNQYADIGDLDGVSDVINLGRKTVRVGDSNGYADRLAIYNRAKQVLASEEQQP